MSNFWLTRRLERVAQALKIELEAIFIKKAAKASARRIYLTKLDFLSKCGLTSEEIKKIRIEVQIEPSEFYDGIMIEGIITGFTIYVL